MHWYVGMLLSHCAKIRADMVRPVTEREMHHVDACAHLSLLKGLLESYQKKAYNNGFADVDTGRYILGMIVDDLQDAIVTVLETTLDRCKISVDCVSDELTADHLARVLRNRVSMLTSLMICGNHVMCSNWLIDNVQTSQLGSENEIEVKFMSGGHLLFSAVFRYLNELWVCSSDLASAYLGHLAEMGCEVAQVK